VLATFVYDVKPADPMIDAAVARFLGGHAGRELFVSETRDQNRSAHRSAAGLNQMLFP